MAAPRKLVPLRASGGHRTLAFGLIRIPVGTMPARESVKRRSATLLHDGHRVQQVYRDVETGELIESRTELEKGFEHNGGYVQLHDSELPDKDGDGVLELVAAIPASSVDPDRVDKTNLCWPEDTAAAEAYNLVAAYVAPEVRDMPGDDNTALIAKGRDKGTDKVFVIRWSERFNCLVIDECGYEQYDRLAEAEVIHEGIASLPAPDDKALALAGSLFDSLPTEFDFAEVEDTYAAELDHRVVAKAGGQTIEAAPAVQKAAPTDLMEALRASVEAQGAEKATPKRGKAKAAA